ncbi:MAG: hypothetical protein KGO96_13755 [Elusimicrobia bacterium]|nr:hypothetical protein [Elusimicrobiota bacterium]MDE2236274.1 hypothetical protein [Elusimicrobiota bacterium]MDE2426960.1 hypothetical protein [Elusimicrobiota bacterium]
MRTIFQKATAAVLALAVLLNVGPVLAIQIEGQGTDGQFHTVAVTTSGQLSVASGGAAAAPTCDILVFNTLEISTGVVQSVLGTNANRAQALFYNEGPDDIYFSSQSARGIYPRPSPWARFPAGTIWSIDSPASNLGAIEGESWGSSTYTILDVTTCGN